MVNKKQNNLNRKSVSTIATSLVVIVMLLTVCPFSAIAQSKEGGDNKISNEEVVWGDKGFIEISKLNIGGWSGDNENEVNYRAKYLEDFPYIAISAVIVPHVEMERTATYDIKVISPEGTLLRNRNSKNGYSYSVDAVIKKGEKNLDLASYFLEDAEPGTYKIEVYHKGKKLASGKKSVSRPPAYAIFENVDKTYNYYDSNTDSRGINVTFDIHAYSLEDQKLTVTMKFYLPDGEVLTYADVPVEQSHTITPMYKDATFHNGHFFFSNSYLFSALPGRYGSLNFRMVIRNKAGKLLDTYNGSIDWN